MGELRQPAEALQEPVRQRDVATAGDDVALDRSLVVVGAVQTYLEGLVTGLEVDAAAPGPPR